MQQRRHVPSFSCTFFMDASDEHMSIRTVLFYMYFSIQANARTGLGPDVHLVGWALHARRCLLYTVASAGVLGGDDASPQPHLILIILPRTLRTLLGVFFQETKKAVAPRGAFRGYFLR